MRTSETAVHARFKLSSRSGSYSCVYRPSPKSKQALGYKLAMCGSGVLLICMSFLKHDLDFIRAQNMHLRMFSINAAGELHKRLCPAFGAVEKSPE